MTSYKIGELSCKYETGGKGPGYISNGSQWGDPGGDSYGSYQLESNLGTLQAYLKNGDKYAQMLQGYKINTAAFKAKWREIADNDPDGFQQSQFDFLCEKPGGHNDAIRYAKALGWDVDNFALQSAIFSTSNQSGGWKKGIFDKAGIKASDNITTQINKLYDARAAYFKKIRLTDNVRNAIIKARTIDERKDCLRLV